MEELRKTRNELFQNKNPIMTQKITNISRVGQKLKSLRFSYRNNFSYTPYEVKNT